MGDSRECAICGQPATVHVSHIADGKVTQVHYCEACSQGKGATDPAVFKLAEVLSAQAVAPTLTCPACGFTDADFRKRGRLGCPSCWSVFGDALGGLLTKVQHETVHHGRAPAGAPVDAASVRARIESLRRELEAAARAEDFEAAARLRDEIARLEASLNPS
ncbi:MAG: UvrB/UvrC motif-containing protein [Opitutia bacterium]